ncbi:phosphoglycerate dehydrogenase, partial [Staphylococcus aureus]
LGTVLAACVGKAPSSVTVEVRGELASEDVSVLQLAALRGVFSAVVEEQVTFVNAPKLADERGVETSVTTAPESPNYR